MSEGPIAGTISSRRSLRKFAPEPVDPALVRRLVELACMAPAPHHSRPWRFAHIASAEAKERLAEAMAEAWLADLTSDGRSVHKIDAGLRRSREQITGAPVLLLSCIDMGGGRQWPDAGRRAAERDMFVQSLGAALQNLLLAAYEAGLAGYLKGAPLFCPDAVRQALSLPQEWEPAFLVLLGYPDRRASPAPRPALRLPDVLTER